jgi:hypothetical protein
MDMQVGVEEDAEVTDGNRRVDAIWFDPECSFRQ